MAKHVLEALLARPEIRFSSRELADLIWLANRLEASESNASSSQETSKVNSKEPNQKSESNPPEIPEVNADASKPPKTERIYIPDRQKDISNRRYGRATSIASAKTFSNELQIARRFRPIIQKTNSRHEFTLNEDATVYQTAETGFLSPVLKPLKQRWLSLKVVIDQAPSMLVWQNTISEFLKILEKLGAFRRIDTFHIDNFATSDKHISRLFTFVDKKRKARRQVSHFELTDSTRQSLVLFISDTTGYGWCDGSLIQLMSDLHNKTSFTLLHLLPEKLWSGTALHNQEKTRFLAQQPCPINSQLTHLPLDTWFMENEVSTDELNVVKLPVISFDPNSIGNWANMIGGLKARPQFGVLLEKTPTTQNNRFSNITPGAQSAEKLVVRFKSLASPSAQCLAGYLAAWHKSKLTFSIMRLIQRVMFPESTQLQLAEVLRSGILQREHDSSQSVVLSNSNRLFYSFTNEKIVQALQNTIFEEDILRIQTLISEYRQKTGSGNKKQDAYFQDDSSNETIPTSRESRPITTQEEESAQNAQSGLDVVEHLPETESHRSHISPFEAPPDPATGNNVFENDIFISYHHSSNHNAWVTNFRNILQARLEQLRGTKCNVFMYEDGRRDHEELKPHLTQTIKASRILVAIISPGYLNSYYCRLERDTFLANRGDHNTLVRIDKLHMPPPPVPPELAKRIAFPFYKYDRNSRVSRDINPKSDIFYTQINDLAHHLIDKLDGIAEYKDRSNTIYLANTSREMIPLREELRRELLQQKFNVYPPYRLGGTEAAISAQAHDFMKQSLISIHLVGSDYRPVPGGDVSITELQLDIASELCRDSHFYSIVWHPDNLPEPTARQNKLIESIATNEFLDEYITTPSLERFKDIIAYRVFGSKAAAPIPPGKPRGRTIYLCYGPAAWTARATSGSDVSAIRNYLLKEGYRVFDPEYEGSEEEIAEEHLYNLNNCDAVLVYLGNADPDWNKGMKRSFKRGQPFGEAFEHLTTGVYLEPGVEFLADPGLLIARGAGIFLKNRLDPFLKAVEALKNND